MHLFWQHLSIERCHLSIDGTEYNVERGGRDNYSGHIILNIRNANNNIKSDDSSNDVSFSIDITTNSSAINDDKTAFHNERFSAD